MPNSHLTNRVEIAEHLVAAFGGPENITYLDACLTRLRVTVTTLDTVNLRILKQLGAQGSAIANNEIQAIFGKNSDTLKSMMQTCLNHYYETEIVKELIIAFGGQKNISSVDACMTRLRVAVVETINIDHKKLKQLGAMKILVEANNIQAIFGKKSDMLREKMAQYMLNKEG